MVDIDVLLRSPTGEIGTQGNRNSVFVGAADIDHIAPLQPLKPGVAIGRQIGACDMPEMELSIGIGGRRCDQNLFTHWQLGYSLQLFRSPLTVQAYTGWGFFGYH